MVTIRVLEVEKGRKGFVALARILQEDKARVQGDQLAALLAWWGQEIAPIPLVEGAPYLPGPTKALFEELLKATEQHGANPKAWARAVNAFKEKGEESWTETKKAVHALREEAARKKTRQIAWSALAPVLTEEGPTRQGTEESPPPPSPKDQPPAQTGAPGPDSPLLRELQEWREWKDALTREVAELAEAVHSLQARTAELEARLEGALRASAPEPAPNSLEDPGLEEEVLELKETVAKLTHAFNEVVVGKLLRAYVAGSLLMVKVEKVPPLPEEILKVLEDIHAKAAGEEGETPPKNPFLSWLRRP
ncbi:hypothetical protein HRbin39_00112 [bacterium HR39]|nr:hypothetical protein HRbin39_00112 [bacterium HR39]